MEILETKILTAAGVLYQLKELCTPGHNENGILQHCVFPFAIANTCWGIHPLNFLTNYK